MEYKDEEPIEYTFSLLKFIKNMDYSEEKPIKFNFYLSSYLKQEINKLYTGKKNLLNTPEYKINKLYTLNPIAASLFKATLSILRRMIMLKPEQVNKNDDIFNSIVEECREKIIELINDNNSSVRNYIDIEKVESDMLFEYLRRLYTRYTNTISIKIENTKKRKEKKQKQKQSQQEPKRAQKRQPNQPESNQPESNQPESNQPEIEEQQIKELDKKIETNKNREIFDDIEYEEEDEDEEDFSGDDEQDDEDDEDFSDDDDDDNDEDKTK